MPRHDQKFRGVSIKKNIGALIVKTNIVSFSYFEISTGMGTLEAYSIQWTTKVVLLKGT